MSYIFFPFSPCIVIKLYIYIYKSKNFGCMYTIQRSYPWVILWTYLAIKFEDFYFTEKFCKEVGSPFGTLKFNATSYSFQKLADSWLNLVQSSKERIADCRNTKPVGRDDKSKNCSTIVQGKNSGTKHPWTNFVCPGSERYLSRSCLAKA